jgi:hypothetical protein
MSWCLFWFVYVLEEMKKEIQANNCNSEDSRFKKNIHSLSTTSCFNSTGIVRRLINPIIRHFHLYQLSVLFIYIFFIHSATYPDDQIRLSLKKNFISNIRWMQGITSSSMWLMYYFNNFIFKNLLTHKINRDFDKI